MNTVMSSCPIVRAEITTLFERVEIAGQEFYFPFHKRLLWTRESETRLIVTHDGAVVDALCTINDFYGFLSSVTTSIEVYVPEKAERLRVTKDTQLTIEALVTIRDVPRLPDESPEGIAHNANPKFKKRFLEVPCGSCFGGFKYWYTDPDAYTADGRLKPGMENVRLEPVEIVKSEPWYTTREGIGDIPARAAALIREWNEKSKAQRS